MADNRGIKGLYKYWVVKDKELFLKVYERADNRMLEWQQSAVAANFKRWLDYCDRHKKFENDGKLTNKTIEVLKTSIRTQRTPLEKDILRKFIINNLTCVPSDKLNATEMDRLCNEVDWNPLVGKSILFLQGDFGNVYYMIAKGSVALYLEPSKDKEMNIAREFGHLRGQPFSGTEEDYAKFGNLIFVCPKGAGFGEYAILNATQKIRSCAAIANDENSVLMILHADTYDFVLRKFHTRQRQLNLARSLLTELPLFSHYGFSKISAVAYTLKCQIFTNKSYIVKAGMPVNCVYLIISGEVKVISRQASVGAKTDEDERRFGSSADLERKIPPMAYAQIGRGFFIGDMAVQNKSPTFLMDYMVTSAQCEVFEMPLSVYLESVQSTSSKEAYTFEKLEAASKERDRNHQARIGRACNAVRSMMKTAMDEVSAKYVLMDVLPALMNGHSDHTKTAHSPARDTSASSQQLSTSYGFKQPLSPRKDPFGTSLLVPNMKSVVDNVVNTPKTPGKRTPAIELPTHNPQAPSNLVMKSSSISPRKRTPR